MASEISSVAEYFETLNARFAPEGAKGVDAVFQWELDGDVWHAIIKDQTLEVFHAPHPSPTTKIKITPENFVKLNNGKLNHVLAMATGKLKLEGNRMIAGRMRTMFP